MKKKRSTKTVIDCPPVNELFSKEFQGKIIRPQDTMCYISIKTKIVKTGNAERSGKLFIFESQSGDIHT